MSSYKRSVVDGLVDCCFNIVRSKYAAIKGLERFMLLTSFAYCAFLFTRTAIVAGINFRAAYPKI